MAEKYATIALQYAEDHKHSLRSSHYGLGYSYAMQKKYIESYKAFLSRYLICKEEYDEDTYCVGGLAEAAKDLGFLLYKMQKYKEAISYTE